jgi:hypothetical protein
VGSKVGSLVGETNEKKEVETRTMGGVRINIDIKRAEK